MKLSEMIAAAGGIECDILILRDWGELAHARIVRHGDLADGDPVIEAIARAGGALILCAKPKV